MMFLMSCIACKSLQRYYFFFNSISSNFLINIKK